MASSAVSGATGFAKDTCPLCSTRSSRAALFRERNHDVVRCDTCDLFFIQPYPESLSKVHQTVSDFAYEDLEILDVERQYKGEVEYFRLNYPKLRTACGGATSVLDIGCGTGRLLELFGKDPRIHRVGIELNMDRARFAKGRARCDIHQVPIEDFSSERPFNAIILCNVLSHIPNFDRLFTAIWRLLADGGRVILQVGEVEKDFDHRAIFDWGIPNHLHFLGMRTIDFIAAKYGFTVIEHSRVPYSKELFRPERWRMPGRSWRRNVVKRMIAAAPGALPLLSRLYEARYGKSIFSSMVVLSPREWEPEFRLKP